jgi:hypothetical protein
LQADAQALARMDVHRFLEGCRVPAPEITRTIELARSIADASGSALLRIEVGAVSSTVTVAAVRSGAPLQNSPRTPQGVGEPLREALVA